MIEFMIGLSVGMHLGKVLLDHVKPLLSVEFCAEVDCIENFEMEALEVAESMK